MTQGGAVKCWGRNDHGQLGQSGPLIVGDDETPGAIPFVELDGIALEAITSGDRTFVLMADGSLRALGADASTELRIGGSAAQLVAGDDFACARLVGGAVRCWGANDSGQLGLGYPDDIDDDELPGRAEDVALGGPALELAAGAHHACALLDGGQVRCWGANDFGQLGLGHTEAIGDDELPASATAIALGGQAVRLVAGGLHACAVLSTGAVRCWGDGSFGQLGHGSTERVGDDEVPKTAGDVPVGGTVVDLAAGAQHTCAVLSTGAVRCWGDGSFGQLGYGSTALVGDAQTPAIAGDLELGSGKATDVFSGPMSRSTCIRLDEGAARCWGANDVGQLGQGHIMNLGDEPEEMPGDLPNIIILDDDDD